MKAIFVMFDTLNRRMLPPYGGAWVQAPNVARLAERAVTFDNAYIASMPCIPARRELHTGRYNFLHRSWGPLEPFDESMPELLGRAGVYTHLASDHQHYWEDGGATYHTRYRTWEFFRGQEGDPWKGQVADPAIPPSAKKLRGETFRQDWVNRQYLRREEDQPQSHTFASGLEFIRTNHAQDRWYLQIETFDPHEPFFTQPRYQARYPHAYDGPHFDWPDYGRVIEPKEQIEHLRYQYAALVTMCDQSLGKVLDLMDALQLWDDTLLIVGTDHGFLLGEHDWWAKSVQPWYNEVAHTPLFIWDPRSRKQGERRQSLVQMIDLPATLLEYFDVPRPDTMQGSPLRETVADDTPVHDAVLFGVFGGHVNLTDGRYVYMRAPARPANTPLFEYTLMPTHMRSRFGVAELQDLTLAGPFSFTRGVRTLKIPARTYVDAHALGAMLFDLQRDPQQLDPIVDDDLERRLIGRMVALMRWNDAPAEQYERLGLPADGQVRDEHLMLAQHHARAIRTGRHVPDELPSSTARGVAHLDRPLQVLLAAPPSEAAVRKHFPQLIDSPLAQMAESLTVLQLATFSPAGFTRDKLEALAAELADLADEGAIDLGELPS